MCSSACFFVFVAGVRRQGGVSGYPIIGIHRPFLADLDLSTLAADQVLNVASRNRLFVETYLKEMGVQAKYADLMYSTPKDDIRWITQQEFEQDFYGIIPELKEWIGVRGKQLATDLESISAGLTPDQREMIASDRKRLADPIRQQAEAENSMADDGWLKVFGSNSLDKAKSYCSGLN
jgi:hypothetical protein